MGGIFIYEKENMDFDLENGKCADGIIIKDTDRLCENVKRSAAAGMEILIELPAETVDKVQKISIDAGRVVFSEEEIRYVSIKDIKRTISRLEVAGNEVSGFIIPVPDIYSLIWDDELGAMYAGTGGTEQELFELLDNDLEISAVRSWYYENAEKHIFHKYLLPVKEYFESIGKTGIFDIGETELQYYLARKMINPIRLKSRGCTLALRTKAGRSAEPMGFTEGDYFLYEDYGKRLLDNGEKDILLVKPVRGMIQRFKRGGSEFNRHRIETPALLTAIESVYLSDKLSEKGYQFDVCDEFSFDERENFKQYKHILICESCMFTKQEMSVIEEIGAMGVRINDKELLDYIRQEGEN